MEIEEIHEDAPEEWLCGAIGSSLRRAAQDATLELTPIPPSSLRPASAFSNRSRASFRDDVTEVSVALDAIADGIFGGIAAPALPRVPTALRRGGAVTLRNARHFSSNSTAADIVRREDAKLKLCAECFSSNSTAADAIRREDIKLQQHAEYFSSNSIAADIARREDVKVKQCAECFSSNSTAVDIVRRKDIKLELRAKYSSSSSTATGIGRLEDIKQKQHAECFSSNSTAADIVRREDIKLEQRAKYSSSSSTVIGIVCRKNIKQQQQQQQHAECFSSNSTAADIVRWEDIKLEPRSEYFSGDLTADITRSEGAVPAQPVVATAPAAPRPATRFRFYSRDASKGSFAAVADVDESPNKS